MLVSEDISANAMPGICKMLERFILLYRMDTVFKRLHQKGWIQQLSKDHGIKGIGRAGADLYLKLKEGETPEGFEDFVFVDEVTPGQVLGYAATKTAQGIKQSVKKGTEDEAGAEHETIKSKKVESFKLNMQMDSIGLEPTFIQVGGGEGKYAIIGIKVVPFPVKSEPSLPQMLLDDRKVKFMMSYVHAMGRKATRLVFTFARKIPFLKDYIGGISGNPKKDVVWAMSEYKDDVFVLLNKMDLDDDLFKQTGGMRQLFRMGWNQIIVADDVNKRATFCMKEFKGLCSSVPYSFMYAAMGKEKVYENLEDIRRSSGPFYKLSNPKRLFGEAKVSDKLGLYLEEAREVQTLMEDMDFLTEDLKSFIAKLKPGKLEKDIKSMKDDKKAEAILKKVPDVPLSTVEKLATKVAPDFPKAYKLSQKVVKNSVPKLPDELANHFAAAIAIKGSYKSDDAIGDTKDVLRDATPILMRAAPHILVGTGLGLIWIKIALGMMGAGFMLPAGLILIIARAAHKIVKGETKLAKQQVKRGERAQKRQTSVDIAKAKGPRVPMVYVQK